MKTAFLFPGQGSQTIGMGQDVALALPSANHLFDQAADILGLDIRSICFNGPEDKLNSTAMSQPAIFVTSAALLEAVKIKLDSDLSPDVVAGLSMGEYTALYAAGLLSFEDGLRLVQKRGQAMQEAASQNPGSMVSIIGLDEEKTLALCKEASQGELLVPTNLNCPGQIVISGTGPACERAVLIAGEMGAMKAVPLAVSGAFHTELMAPAASALKSALETTTLRTPSTPKVIANVDATYYKTPADIVIGLTQQLVSPILWQRCMETLLAEGVDTFYEIGPGRVLTGLMRRIHRKTKVNNVSSMETLDKIGHVAFGQEPTRW